MPPPGRLDRWPILLALAAGIGCCCCLWPGLAAGAPLGRHIRTIYWNSSSTVFEEARRLGGLLVQKGDRLLVACPTDGTEFYRIYWTHSSGAAADCRVEPSQVFFLLECVQAGHVGVFHVTDFSPIPGAPTFDRPVFLFTPSSGHRAGLGQTSGGACQTRRLSLTVEMGDPDSPLRDRDRWQRPPEERPQPPGDQPQVPHQEQPRPSARQTPAATGPGDPGSRGNGGGADAAKLDSQTLNLITGAAASLPCPPLLFACVALQLMATVLDRLRIRCPDLGL